ncbi:MAG: DMT family transporter [Pseudomonadota bacterium]
MTASAPQPASAVMQGQRRPQFAALGVGDWLLYIVLVCSWSASWYALSLQVGQVAVPTSLFWRFVIAASIMWVWVGLRNAKGKPGLPDANGFTLHLAFAGMGVFIFSLNFALYYWASAYLISGLLSVMFSLASVFSLALTALFTRSKPPLPVVLGALIGVTGIALMFAPEIAGQDWATGTILGLALCTGGTLSFCLGSQISARLQRQSIPVVPASAWGMTYGALFSGLTAVAGGNSLAIIWEPVYLGSLVFLAIVSSVIAFWSYLTLVGRIGAGRAGYATVGFPVLALCISAVMVGYGFPALAMIGLVLVLAGNVLVLRAQK